ncbi:hypothetical protein KIPB_007763, partial [Kipferlia bialata]
VLSKLPFHVRDAYTTLNTLRRENGAQALSNEELGVLGELDDYLHSYVHEAVESVRALFTQQPRMLPYYLAQNPEILHPLTGEKDVPEGEGRAAIIIEAGEQGIESYMAKLTIDSTVVPMGMNEFAVLSEDTTELTLCRLRSDGTVSYETITAPGRARGDYQDVGLAHLNGELYLCMDTVVQCLSLDTREWRPVWRGAKRGQGRDGYRELEVLGSSIFGYNHNCELYRFDTERPSEGFRISELPCHSYTGTYVKGIRTIHDELYIIVKQTQGGQYGYMRLTEEGLYSHVCWCPNGVSLKTLTWERERNARFGMDLWCPAENLTLTEAAGRCLVLRFEDEDNMYIQRYSLDTISGEWQVLGLERGLTGREGETQIDSLVPLAPGISSLAMSGRRTVMCDLSGLVYPGECVDGLHWGVVGAAVDVYPEKGRETQSGREIEKERVVLRVDPEFDMEF